MTGAAMIAEMSAVKLRQNLGDALGRVQYRRESVVITKDGRAVAALVDVATFEKIRALGERFDQLTARVADAYADVPEDQGLAQIDALAQAVRHA
ncbi:MAG: type II toxin-antitoxin system Phd/YefM family antitoxin [Bifidobacteriaceae bacterium]|nr:type II toxin-antitoxin system Phd/YefM family antitoxin [Bifidobacteriaceae bacterium]